MLPMAELPRVSGDEVIRALERLGFVQVRQRGSHVAMRKRTESGDIGCVVPRHRELATGTLRGILKQAGVSVSDLMKQL